MTHESVERAKMRILQISSSAIGVWAKEYSNAVSKGTQKKSALAEHVLSYEKPREINWRGYQ